MSKTGFGTVLDVPGHEIRWHRKILFSTIQSYNPEWREVGSVAGSGSRGDEMAVVDAPVLNDLEFLSELYAQWTQVVGAIKPEPQKECGLLRAGMRRLHIKVTTDSFVPGTVEL